MIRDLRLTVGDTCGDRTGLRVRVEIDIYNRVHFSVIEGDKEDWTMRGEMSRDAFLHRFTRLYCSRRQAA